MISQPMRVISERAVLDLMWRHKGKIVICPMLAITFGAIVLVAFPRTYRSQAKLFLQIGRESVGVDPTAAIGQTITRQQSGRDDEIQSTLEVLRSRNVIGAAVDKVGPQVVLETDEAGAIAEARGTSAVIADAIFAVPKAIVGWARSLDPISERESAIITIERSMDASAGRDSAVIVLQYDSGTPQLAQKICTALIEAYQQEHSRVYRNPESSAFFEQQRHVLQQKLDTAEERLLQAKDSLGLASIDGRRGTLESQYSSVSLSRFETQQQIITAAARVEDLESQLSKLPERMVVSSKSVPNLGGDMLRDQYYALQLKEMDLKARYKGSHPLVQAVSKQAADARQVIEDTNESRLETTDEVNPIHRELSLELKKQRNVLAGLHANLKKLDEQELAVRRDLKALNQSELQMAQLERDAELARGKYMEYANYFEEARMDAELVRGGISNLSVVQPPSLQEKPVAPSKMLVALGTLLLATFGTAAAVLTSERLHGVFRQETSSPRDAFARPYGAPEPARELQPARNGA